MVYYYKITWFKAVSEEHTRTSEDLFIVICSQPKIGQKLEVKLRFISTLTVVLVCKPVPEANCWNRSFLFWRFLIRNCKVSQRCFDFCVSFSRVLGQSRGWRRPSPPQAGGVHPDTTGWSPHRSTGRTSPSPQLGLTFLEGLLTWDYFTVVSMPTRAPQAPEGHENAAEGRRTAPLSAWVSIHLPKHSSDGCSPLPL